MKNVEFVHRMFPDADSMVLQKPMGYVKIKLFDNVFIYKSIFGITDDPLKKPYCKIVLCLFCNFPVALRYETHEIFLH